MRSSSSGARAVVSTGVHDFASWTPDALSPGFGLPGPDPAIQIAVDEAVEATLEAARAEALVRKGELLRQAEERGRALAEEAFHRGFEEGRAEGELAEAARLRTAVLAARVALDELRAGEIRWTGTIEENVCALAVVVARQIIGRELQMDVGPVAELVRSALKEFPIDQPIRIRINPADLNALSSVGAVEGEAMAAIVVDRDARWLPDASISPGGCMIEGRERIIDGRVDTALERVYRRLSYNNA